MYWLIERNAEAGFGEKTVRGRWKLSRLLASRAGRARCRMPPRGDDATANAESNREPPPYSTALPRNDLKRGRGQVRPQWDVEVTPRPLLLFVLKLSLIGDGVKLTNREVLVQPRVRESCA